MRNRQYLEFQNRAILRGFRRQRAANKGTRVHEPPVRLAAKESPYRKNLSRKLAAAAQNANKVHGTPKPRPIGNAIKTEPSVLCLHVRHASTANTMRSKLALLSQSLASIPQPLDTAESQSRKLLALGILR